MNCKASVDLHKSHRTNSWHRTGSRHAVRAELQYFEWLSIYYFCSWLSRCNNEFYKLIHGFQILIAVVQLSSVSKFAYLPPKLRDVICRDIIRPIVKRLITLRARETASQRSYDWLTNQYKKNSIQLIMDILQTINKSSHCSSLSRQEIPLTHQTS